MIGFMGKWVTRNLVGVSVSGPLQDQCPVLQNANVECEHRHLLSWNPFLIFEEYANADATYGQVFL